MFIVKDVVRNRYIFHSLSLSLAHTNFRAYLLGLQMSAGVHGQTASAAAEAVALGSVLAGVAVLAEQLLLVLGAVGGVQGLVAQACVVLCMQTLIDLCVWYVPLFAAGFKIRKRIGVTYRT